MKELEYYRGLLKGIEVGLAMKLEIIALDMPPMGVALAADIFDAGYDRGVADATLAYTNRRSNTADRRQWKSDYFSYDPKRWSTRNPVGGNGRRSTDTVPWMDLPLTRRVAQRRLNKPRSYRGIRLKRWGETDRRK